MLIHHLTLKNLQNYLKMNINERYDEMKNLLRISRELPTLLNERINVATSLQNKMDDDVSGYENYYTNKSDDFDDDMEPEEKTKKYRINNGLLVIHGKSNRDVEITTDEKIAFQQTMEEFTESVSDLVDFDVLNLYMNSVQWSGTVIDDDLDFIFTVGENGGIYIKGDMVRVDEEFLSTINRLQQFYQKFKSKWSKVLANRKKTQPNEY